MQPYQEASQEINRQQAEPRRIAKNLALGIGGTGLFVGKVAPFLSKYIPEQLAIKGLSKVSPKLGKFITGSMNQGFTFDAIKDFIGEKIEGESMQEPPQENRSIIEQYSPELHQFLDQEIKKGRDVLQAGALAQNDKRFMKIIDKIQKDHKTPWSAILQSVFGGGPSQATQSQQATPTRDLLRQQGQQQQPQQGGLDPELASLLQQGNSILSKFRGNRG